MPLKSWLRACKTRPWMTRRFGMTLPHSMANRGVRLWIRSLRDGLARPSRSQESGSASTMNAGSGLKCGESFAKLMPDGSLEKMFRGCYLPTMEPLPEKCSGTWPRWGLLQHGVFFLLPPLARRSAGSDCSSWPTATANTATYINGERGENLREAAANWRTPATTDVGTPIEKLTAADGGPPEIGHRMYRDGTNGERINQTQSLALQIQLWSTPGAAISNDGETPETWQARADKLKEKHINGNGAGTPLAIAAQQWASPAAGGGGSVSRGGNRIDEPLLAGQAEQVTLWATPAVQNASNVAGPSQDQRNTPPLTSPVMSVVEMWDSPTAHDGRRPGADTSSTQGTNLNRQSSLFGLQAQPTEASGSESLPSDPTSRQQSRPRLNARFVEWLQGLPHGWTTLEPMNLGDLETWFARHRAAQLF